MASTSEVKCNLPCKCPFLPDYTLQRIFDGGAFGVVSQIEKFEGEDLKKLALKRIFLPDRYIILTLLV